MEYKKSFWEGLYESGDTGWDIGYPSTPLTDYIDQIHNKKLHILIPGAGNAYEAEYLHNIGYQNVFILDISEQPLTNFIKRVPRFSEDHVIHQNFFEHTGAYDLILEQTFFCALEKNLRPQYVNKMHELLVQNGTLAGLLFNSQLNENTPPYGGNKEEYYSLFQDKFEIQEMNNANNSIAPRLGRELFFKMTKKD